MKRVLCWQFLVPALTLLLLGLSHQTFGPISIGALILSVVTLFVYPVAILVSRLKAGDRGSGGGRLLLCAVTSFLCILVILVVMVSLRGEFHRAHAHRDDNVAFHPRLGHSPVLRAEDRANGLKLSDTIGQRLEKIAPGREHVVILGDSVLYGWRMEDDETAAAELGEALESAQVVNMSVSGYSIDQYYLYLDEHLHRLDPLVVVVGVYAGNDYESAAMSHWSGHSTPLFVPDGDGLRLFREHTPRLNCIDALSGSLLFKPLWSSFDAAMSLLAAVCNVRTLDEEEHRLVVSRLFKSIEALVTGQGGRLLYVLLPDLNDFNRDSWYWKEKSRYRDLEVLLREGGYDVLWLYDDLCGSPGEPSDYFIEGDSAHLNRAGHRLLAERLELYLEDHYGID